MDKQDSQDVLSAQAGIRITKAPVFRPGTNGFLARFLLAAIFFGAVSAHANVTLPVNSPAARFSPATWAGDAGRGGALRRVTWNNGAWCEWRWSTTSIIPHAVLQIANPIPGSAISYFLDGVLTDNVPVPVTGGIPIAGLTRPGPHTLVVYTRNSRQARRWRSANAYTVSGLTLDDSAAPLPAPPLRSWVLIVGDSITEGIQADNGRDSSLCDYSFLIGQGLNAAGYDYAVSACGYSGWIRPGDEGGDVPAYYSVRGGESRWDKIDGRTSLLDVRGHLSGWGGVGQEPAAVLFNYAVNECLSGAEKPDLQTSVTRALAALRHAAPRAWLLILIPPGLADTHVYPNGPSYIASLKAGVSAYLATHHADHRTVAIDLGPNAAHALESTLYGGGVHPNAAGQAYLAPLILQALLARIKAH